MIKELKFKVVESFYAWKRATFNPIAKALNQAFTLVELLVVIAILAILAALLIPIGKSMIEKGNSTKCINNLRQIGGAIGIYMTENDGYLPYASGPDFSGSGTNIGFNHYWAPLPSLLNVGSNLPSSFTNRSNYDNPIAKHPFNCPSCKSGFRTYAANMHAMGYMPGGSAYPRRKLTYFSNASKLVLIADDSAGDPSPNNSGTDQFSSSDYLTKIGVRHNGKANILFADFHIESLNKTNLSNTENIKQ